MLDSAPTEEGFFLAGQIDAALASLHSDESSVLAARRYSRSFSEPNLTLKVLQARARALPVPCATGSAVCCNCCRLIIWYLF